MLLQAFGRPALPYPHFSHSGTARAAHTLRTWAYQGAVVLSASLAVLPAFSEVLFPHAPTSTNVLLELLEAASLPHYSFFLMLTWSELELCSSK